jgi:hypothetical protein
MHDSDQDSTTALLAWGLLAGFVGVAAMTVAEKLEQSVTGRPNSFVPGHTLERLLQLPRKPDRDRLWMNWTMHWGQPSTRCCERMVADRKAGKYSERMAAALLTAARRNLE